MANVFTKDLGVHQGRIRSRTAPQGDFVYELGHANRIDAHVKIGDFHEIKQTFVMTDDARFLRASIVVATPAFLPVGSWWRVSALLNEAVMVKRRLRTSKRKITLSDWRISLADANPAPGENEIVFRLELTDTDEMSTA